MHTSVVCLFVFQGSSDKPNGGVFQLQRDICLHFLTLPDSGPSVFVDVVFHHLVHRYSLHSTDQHAVDKAVF